MCNSIMKNIACLKHYEIEHGRYLGIRDFNSDMVFLTMINLDFNKWINFMFKINKNVFLFNVFFDRKYVCLNCISDMLPFETKNLSFYFMIDSRNIIDFYQKPITNISEDIINPYCLDWMSCYAFPQTLDNCNVIEHFNLLIMKTQ